MDFRLYPLIFAPFIGSFLGVLILRLPEHQPVAWTRSACQSCGHALAPWEMVPIISYLALRGRCHHCGAPIGALHIQVELAAVAVAASAAWLAADPAWLWADCVLGWTLLALAWIDARSFLLPDLLTLPLVPAGLAVTLWFSPDTVLDHAVAAAIGYSAFWLIAMLYHRVRGVAGLGLGDAKLMAVAGAWLGLAPLPWVIASAALLGLAIALPRYARGSLDPAHPIPFGPALAAAIWAARLYPYWNGVP